MKMHRLIPERQRGRAFSLLEVMIAMALFFTAVFAILGLTTRSLEMAHSIQQSQVDIDLAIADLVLTNQLEEGVESGDFGHEFPRHSWTREVFEVATNGLFRVDLTVHWTSRNQPVESTTSFLLYRPNSAGGGRLGLQ